MKIIFLDIDGVLNGYGLITHLIFKICGFLHIPARIVKRFIDPFGVHYFKVRRLAKIVRITGAEVVLSSSWRHAYFDDSHQSDDIKKLKRLFKRFKIHVMDKTDRDVDGIRGAEICDWMHCAQHLISIESYIVIDDETCDIIDYIPTDRIIKTTTKPHDYIINGHWSERTGLKNKHVKQAIKALRTPCF
jgi:hypothetical protein